MYHHWTGIEIGGLVFGVVGYIIISLAIFTINLQYNRDDSYYIWFTKVGKSSFIAFGWIIYGPLFIVSIPLVGAFYILHLPCRLCFTHISNHTLKKQSEPQRVIPVAVVVQRET